MLCCGCGCGVCCGMVGRSGCSYGGGIGVVWLIEVVEVVVVLVLV